MAQFYEYFSLWFKSINSIRSRRNQKFLTDYAHKHKIYILCYKSIENEVLLFFVENERLAQNLCLYTLQPLQAVTDEFQEIVDYLKSHGAEYVAFDHPSDSIYRSDYMFL